MNTGDMKDTRKLDRISRRGLIKAAAGFAAGAALMPKMSMAQCSLAKTGTVRDRLWLFGVPTNADISYTHHRSTMTPAEGAYYLGIPNVIMIQSLPPVPGPEAGYSPFESPLEQYAIGLRPLKRTVWSIVGSGQTTPAGYTTPAYRNEVMAVAKHSSNCVGLYMDDFFYQKKEQMTGPRKAVLTLEQLKEIRRQARSDGKKLDIWVTYYTMLMDLPLQEYLKLIDVLTIWTWKAEELKNLDANFRKIDTLGPHLKKTLGCYFYDYTTRKPLSVANMKYQCEMGLDWLRQGKIEGIVLLDNGLEDQGFECVEWTRDWIQRVGDIAV